MSPLWKTDNRNQVPLFKRLLICYMARVDSEEKCIKEMGPAVRALIEVRDRKLYRETHATFEDYVRAKWGEKTLKMLAVWGEAVRERN